MFLLLLKGILLMGRFLSLALLQQISIQTRVEFSLTSVLGVDQLPKSEKSIWIHSKDEFTLEVGSYIFDYLGNPVGRINALIDRGVYQQGKESVPPMYSDGQRRVATA